MNICDYRIYILSPKEKAEFVIKGFFAVALLVYVFYESILISFLGGTTIFLLQNKYTEILCKKRQDALLIQFNDFLNSIVGSLSMGYQMGECIVKAHRDLRLIYDETSPIIIELKNMERRLCENLDDEKEVFLDFAKRSGIEDIRNFFDVYLVARETGGNIERIIKNAVGIIIDKMIILREIEAITAQKQFETKIITAMPILVVIFLNITNPEYLSVLYTTFMGRIIMSIAVLGIISAHIISRKIMSIKI
ncbi:MAG: hypothetical protein RR495_01010 [Anaerovoracaceae bacterium]